MSACIDYPYYDPWAQINKVISLSTHCVKLTSSLYTFIKKPYIARFYEYKKFKMQIHSTDHVADFLLFESKKLFAWNAKLGINF